MKKLLLGFLSLVIILSIGKTIKAEVYGSISGRVIDKETQKGVENVFVEIVNSAKYTKTDKNGNYVLNFIPPGDYLINVSFSADSDASLKYAFMKRRELNISLKSGFNIVNADFYLEKIGSISGKLSFSDGITPVISGDIYAFNTTVVYSNAFGNVIGYNTTDNLMRYFRIPKVPNNSNWQLIYVDDRDYKEGKASVYKYDGLVEVSNGNDVQNINFVLKPFANTKIFGQLKDNYGNDMNNVFGRVYFILIEPRVICKCTFSGQGRYLIQGDILPGEYEVLVELDEAEQYAPDSYKIKNRYEYSNNRIKINNNEQKELNLIFDSTKAQNNKF